MINFMYYYRKGKKQMNTKNLSTIKICGKGFGGICFNTSKQFLICGKDAKNLKDLLAHHTDGPDFDRCCSFNRGAGLRVNRILHTKRGILRRQGNLALNIVLHFSSASAF